MMKFETSKAVDFVVIGAGAAGAVVAKELSTAGFQVVVLEQGPYFKNADFRRHDELKISVNWDKPPIGQELLTNNHDLQPNTFRKTEKEKAVLARTVQYGKGVGGGTVHFTANYWRFHEIDFRERSHWGPIAGTGFSDWPISYADLEPFYTKAEWEIGVSGLAGANPFDPPRSKPYPLPPLPVKSSGVLLEKAALKLGWHPFPAPMAILSQPYRGRSQCGHCGFCEMMGCEFGAKSSTLVSVIPMAEKTGRCEIRPYSYVRKIAHDKQGRVNGVIYFDRDKKEILQKAKAVVVCANGAETPRLLLLSKSNRFPQGLANSNGVVGRYLMFDCGTGAMGTFEHPLNEYKSVVVTRVVQDFYNADPKRGFYGGGGMDARFDAYPISYALHGVPSDVPRWGTQYKRWIQENFTRSMMILCHLTTLPMESNSISLDPAVKDGWGLPAMRITYKNHPDDLKNKAFFGNRAVELLQAAGARKMWKEDAGEETSSVHLMGSCRMGDNQNSSVVDKYHRTHDVPNLFLVDGSSFVSAGRNQPTCTIQALAYRAAYYISEAAKKGNIPQPA
jgi:choline dehydrogenase-like flavoprotein